MSDLWRRLLLPTIGVLCLAALPAAAQDEWEERFYNPQPRGDDLLLPMPCGGYMAFREVRTPAPSGPLGDTRVVLGQSDEDTGYSEYIRYENIVGSLSAAPLGIPVRFFYIGKYEVTQDQYDAIMSGTCPDPQMQGLLPASGISWFDAVAFSRAYTEWLYENEDYALPQEGDRRAFLRLPTEVEWEYAARGGEVVDDLAFRQRLFPIDGDVTQYIWFQGPRSANGQLQLIGRLEANPLGLHDIIGNAEEFVLEPYSLNRIGRRHGQVGGFVTRGGSFRTPEGRLRSSMRTEYSYFDETVAQATALDTFGFRLVISAPIIISLERTEELRVAWREARDLRIDTETFNPIDALDRLAEQTSDLELRRNLELISETFASEVSVRNDVEARALRSAISSGAVLARMLRLDYAIIAGVETAFNYERNRDPDSERTQQLAARLQSLRGRFDNTLRAYIGIVTQVADDYSADRHRNELAVQVDSFRQRGLESLVEFAELFTEQALAYQVDQDLDADGLLERIIE